MAITNNTADNERNKFKEATSLSGQPGIVVVNPDGTSIGSSGGTGASATQVQGTAASNAAAVGNPVMVGGKYNATPQTFDDGDVANLQGDVNGNLNVTQATAIAGEDLANNVMKVEQRFSYLNIAAGQATTTVKSGAGFLHSITFNSAATATNTTTVYDNTAASGTVIAIPAATTATVPTTLTYDVSFATGLTIITATANGSNMTVSYR